mmetsp:Transcript_26487/g.63914  ORF Transcript_26487/g.63914 Transcript_26487/m.63914 type:complete len:216 (+) Transcript_26487:82-729(+)
MLGRRGRRDDREERIPVLQKSKKGKESRAERELGVDYHQYGFDMQFIRRCRRIYRVALPPLMSGEAALIMLLLFMIFPPMITQFLFAILPGWTMKTLVSRNLPGFLYTLCITSAVAGLDCIMGGLNFFLSLYISVRLRRRLTYYLHDHYLSHKKFYYHMTQTQQRMAPRPPSRVAFSAVDKKRLQEIRFKMCPGIPGCSSGGPFSTWQPLHAPPL